MAATAKKKRVRARDLAVTCREVGQPKYDFSKVVDLKGLSGRDTSKKGSPVNVTSAEDSSKYVGVLSTPTSASKSTPGIPSTSLPSTPTTVSTSTPGIPSTASQTETQVLGGEIPSSSCLLSEEELYANLLKEKRGIINTDEKYTIYFMQDVDLEKMTLKPNKYYLLKRRGMHFDDIHWVYKCSCNPTRCELIDCCENTMHVSYEDDVEETQPATENSNNFEDRQRDHASNTFVHKCVSKERIPFNSTSNMQETYKSQLVALWCWHQKWICARTAGSTLIRAAASQRPPFLFQEMF